MNKDSVQSSRSETLEELESLTAGPGSGLMVTGAILLALGMTFVRPQYHLGFLEAVKFPLLVSLIPLAFWLPKCTQRWTTQTGAMVGLLILGGLTGPFAVNTFYSFQRWRTLLQLFAGVVFPVAVLPRSGKQIKAIINILILLGVYLAFFGMTHSGTGPGDFLQDENDLCFALNFFLPLVLFFAIERGSAMRKLFLLGAAGAILGGIIITNSRGGFVGLVFVLLYVFLRSKKKMMMTGIFVLLGIGAALLAPAKYWDEISSIQQTDQGTAKSRREFWTVAAIMWLTPKNFFQGVGMGNTPILLEDYAPDWVLAKVSKNIWGRAVHSMYFEMLPDTGLIGTLLFLTIVIKSVRDNRRIGREARDRLKELGRIVPPDKGDEGMQLLKVRRELSYINSLAAAMNGSWVAIVGTGAFISVFYYPPIWLLGGLSSMLAHYWKRFDGLLEDLVGEPEEDLAVAGGRL